MIEWITLVLVLVLAIWMLVSKTAVRPQPIKIEQRINQPPIRRRNRSDRY
jgi:hypothetical protein